VVWSFLLVEDDEKVRPHVASMLEEIGCAVTEAASGDEALKLIKAGTELSVLFTDCMMPGRLDGPGLAREAWHRMPALPVLFTSGVHSSAGLPTGGGKVQFLAKPYTSQQLAQALLSIC
jgi:CheY-like chemotaxis protein